MVFIFIFFFFFEREVDFRARSEPGPAGRFTFRTLSRDAVGLDEDVSRLGRGHDLSKEPGRLEP